MSPDTLRASAYRFLQKRLVGPLPRSTARERGAVLSIQPPARAQGVRRVWFHGASVGELESLRTVVEKSLDSGWETVLTHFSPSAAGAARRLASESGGKPLLYSGYSPWEGAWAEALDRIQPDLFVTAKYEAWPDLWWSLAARGIPLLIVGPKARSSFRFVRRVSAACGCPLPDLSLAIFEETDREALAGLFPEAAIHSATDPRWDRVRARSLRSHPRVEELGRRFAGLPRPWIVLGSVWSEDLSRLGPAMTDPDPATYWLVPHKTDEAHVVELERELARLGVPSARTQASASSAQAPRAILVNEMGFLSELYGLADGAYVGGGFGAGVHSTIEPAIHGLPVLAGPKNAEKFAEISGLRAAGQLTLAQDAATALEGFRGLRERARDGKTRFDSSHRFGGTARVWEIMEKIVSG